MNHTLIHSFDIIGSIFSFLSTVYYIRANKNAWPFALLAIFVNLSLYVLTGLYADGGKETIYLISSLYGWYWWTHGGKHQKEASITNITATHALLLSGIAGFSIYLLSLFLMHFTNSQVPYWDATTTVLSLTAQWLICRKIIECWILWFIADLLYVGLYFYKGIPAHSILLIMYTGMAVVGYLYWRRLARQSQGNDAQSLGTKYRLYKSASSNSFLIFSNFTPEFSLVIKELD